MPELGFTDVLDIIRPLLIFAVDLLTVGLVDEKVDKWYAQGVEWYRTLPGSSPAMMMVFKVGITVITREYASRSTL